MGQVKVFVPEDTVFRLGRRSGDWWKPFDYKTSPDKFNCMCIKVPAESLVRDEKNETVHCDPGYIKDTDAVVKGAERADESQYGLRASKRIYVTREQAAQLVDPEAWWKSVELREKRSSKYCVELHVPVEACIDSKKKGDSFQPALCEPKELERMAEQFGVRFPEAAMKRPCIYGPFRKGDKVKRFLSCWSPEDITTSDDWLATVTRIRTVHRVSRRRVVHLRDDGESEVSPTTYWSDGGREHESALWNFESRIVLVERPKRKRRVGGKKTAVVED